ncbi:MAG TPA: hypothetical protein DEF85_08505 [Clostridiaceae bacterium]|jgi:hypothetical protein|nr:hypothetical protein [Clostridiaceae bacterium]HBN27753.1 hypothetical protein [Clostridiaceae bacterium]HBX48916.1 hypothetical protein [Clostridiaceae bacterium]
MEGLLDGLKENEIISSKNINDIRQYIGEKYPEMPSSKRSNILANSIKSILTKNIPSISGIDKGKVSFEVIKRAVLKSSFSINAYEIFENCLPFFTNGNEEYINCINRWINSHQKNAVTKEQLQNFMTGNDKNIPDKESDNKVDAGLCEDEIVTGCYDDGISTATLQDEIVCTPKEGFKFTNTFKMFYPNAQYKKVSITVLIMIGMLTATFSIHNIATNKKFNMQVSNPLSAGKQEMYSEVYGNKLPPELRYVAIDKSKLKKWLIKKDSILSEEPYISAITETAKQFDINPLLLFAITGQEQAYVPKSDKNSKNIANNPFNVYGSWEEYNTDIYDSSRIASMTIIDISKDRPPDADPIQWINKKYAEDANWYIGVTSIFNQLSREVGSK